MLSVAYHAEILLNDSPVVQVIERNNLGIILDSKLSFSTHVEAAVSKTRKFIGLLGFFSSYRPRNTLDEVNKLFYYLI